MKRAEALKKLCDAGLPEVDAEIVLDRLPGFEYQMVRMLEAPADLTDEGVMHLFGQDNGRAVLILRKGE